MKGLVQRVKFASVLVDGAVVGEIEAGILLFVGFSRSDTRQDAKKLINKCINLRIFQDDNKVISKSVQDVKGGILVVSQFTLYGDCKKGRRPSFTEAMPPKEATCLYVYFLEELKNQYANVQSGIFGADMQVSLVNDGPFTLMI